MLKEKILELFRECEPEVQSVIARVLDEEWAHLSYERPRGIMERIRQIIDTEVRETMKLEWMRLTNFRQFYGDQTIHFSRHQRQNVTVVHGVNGSGKTSLFTALNWCLYGLGVEDMGELVSKQALMEAAVDEEIEMKVQLAFSHAGERLTATRAFSVSKTSSQRWQTKPQTEFSLDSIRRSDGQTRRIPNPTGYVESILPSNVRTYFFFDGEKIDQFTRPSHEAEVREAVRNVLKIEVLERAKNHLGVVAREYQSELRKLASGGIEDLLDIGRRNFVTKLKIHSSV